MHGAATSPKEGIEEGLENDHGVPSSKKMQGERGGGAALKENVCQVEPRATAVGSSVFVPLPDCGTRGRASSQAAMGPLAPGELVLVPTMFPSYRSARSRVSCCCARRSAAARSTCSAWGSRRCPRASSSATSAPQVRTRAWPLQEGLSHAPISGCSSGQGLWLPSPARAHVTGAVLCCCCRRPHLLRVQEQWGGCEAMPAASVWEVLPRGLCPEVPSRRAAEQGLPLLAAHLHDLLRC